MFSLTSVLLLLIPITLIIGGATLVRKRGNPERAEQNYFLFLAWTLIVFSVPILVNWIFPQLNFGYSIFFIPIVPALIVMLLLSVDAWWSLTGSQKKSILIAILSMFFLTVAQFWFGDSKAAWRNLDLVLQATMLFSISLLMFIVWKWGSHFPVLFGILAFLYLALFNWFELGSLSLPEDASLNSLVHLGISELAYLIIPGYVIPVIGILGLDTLNPSSGSKMHVIGRLLIAIILLGLVLYTFFWLGIWDGTDDGVRWLLLLMATIISIISLAIVNGMTASSWQRWLGIPFAILVIPLFYGGNLWIGDKYSNYIATESRARHIQEAIESFHSKTSWYPLSLEELTPGDMLHIPLPMVVPGQDWCYQGGSNYYRLGLVYREHWSSPYFSVRVYASAGDVPIGGWECDQRLAEVKAKYVSDFSQPSTLNPSPESSVSVPRTYVEPILSGISFTVGDWSPDGRYLVFGKTDNFMDNAEQVTIDLFFVDSTTGSICQPSVSQWTVKQSDGLREHYAWLPDGRFLYVTDAGDLWTFKPCASDIEDLTSRFSNTFTSILSFDEKSGKALLIDEGGFWLLDGSSLEVRKIADVPTESYRNFYSWSADGKRLAISILTGAEEGEPAFLYVVNAETGDMEFEMPLQEISDANLPIVEWMTPDQLLLHSKTLTVMDFLTNPPTMTDLIHDVFLLDVEYPNDISSMDSNPGMDGFTIGLRVNIPHNQNAYLYESKSGQVRVYEQDRHFLFFFSDGGWMRLFKWEDKPSYTDEYEMIWMDQPTDVYQLVVEGHLPRSSPQLFAAYFPDTSKLVFSSSQGVSLVSIPSGETIRFWSLRGAERYFSQAYPSPMENAIIVFAGEVGLYYLPLTSN